MHPPLIAIVPIGSLSGAKSRLGAVLDAAERELLALLGIEDRAEPRLRPRQGADRDDSDQRRVHPGMLGETAQTSPTATAIATTP